MKKFSAWQDYIQLDYLPQVQLLIGGLEIKLLPQFDSINEDAKKIEREEQDRLNTFFIDENSDPETIAEKALDKGTEYYGLMTNLRQGLINMFTVALFHLFEQQMAQFYSGMLLSQAEKNNAPHFSFKRLIRKCEEEGIKLTEQENWPKIEELQLVANTIKHGNGSSAKKLQKKQPNLFRMPIGTSGAYLGPLSAAPIPPSIGCIYLTINHVKTYATVIKNFWNDLLEY